GDDPGPGLRGEVEGGAHRPRPGRGDRPRLERAVRPPRRAAGAPRLQRALQVKQRRSRPPGDGGGPATTLCAHPQEATMEGGGFPFGMFGGGDPEDLQRQLGGMMEQMQGGQKVAGADNAINLAVQMTVACITRLDLSGKPEEQAAQVRDAIRALFPEAVMLVKED